MAKLYFRYGAMGSSKTANLLMVRYNYIEKGKKVVILKPKLENRDGELIIKSRIGLEAECCYMEDFVPTTDLDAILVDEVQFLTKQQIDNLAKIVDEFNIPIICYGLRTNFKGELFEGSKRLFELADVIEEIPTICWCGKKAHFNARIVNNEVVRNGEEIELGGNESYTSLCRKHYMEGKIKAEN